MRGFAQQWNVEVEREVGGDEPEPARPVRNGEPQPA
jgi:hypothetical protein